MGPDRRGTSCVMSAIGSQAQRVSRREGSGKEQQTNIIRTRTMGDWDDSTAAALTRAVERRAHVKANKRRPTGRMSDGSGAIVASADWRTDLFRARARQTVRQTDAEGTGTSVPYADGLVWQLKHYARTFASTSGIHRST